MSDGDAMAPTMDEAGTSGGRTGPHYDIETRNVTKSFGRRQALAGIDLRIARGEFVSIFGPNGAGKTTLTRVLCSLTPPSSGEVLVAGEDISEDPTRIRSKVGLISHNPLLYPDLNALENLGFYGALYRVPGLDERIEELLEKVELSHRRYDLVRTYSRGMLQRLSIARALLHSPAILFLDEPYSGLDPHAVDILDGLLGAIRTQHTFLMISHDIEKGLAMCDRALVMSQGSIVLDSPEKDLTVAEFRDTYRARVKEGL